MKTASDLKAKVAKKTTVVHCLHRPYDVYIGRPSVWGNPFVVGKDGTRRQVIEKHKASLTPEQIAEIKRELTGKVIACWCKPLPCHGDTYADICNERG